MREPCSEGHDPCEGGSLHIRGRDAKGCAQFQDGSWITKDRGVCWGPHLGLLGTSRQTGEGDLTRAWLESEFEATG